MNSHFVFDPIVSIIAGCCWHGNDMQHVEHDLVNPLDQTMRSVRQPCLFSDGSQELRSSSGLACVRLCEMTREREVASCPWLGHGRPIVQCHHLDQLA